MAWTPAELLAWLDQVEPRADGRSHFEWLEIKPTAAPQTIQAAYHAIARTRHPDLFRKSLSPTDLDRLVRMYARVSGAYAELRTSDGASAYRRRTTTAAPPPPTSPTAATPAAPAAGTAIDPARAMNARALVLYRRAEGALRTGDRATALLNIKMAIAADPSSQLLRGALAELSRT